ncbi:MAG: N-6 DNA methylase, partial [Gemmatimonadota bacterium]
MANTAPDFRSALERFDRPARIDALIRALGHEPALLRLDAGRATTMFAAGPALPAGVWRVAVRGGMTVLLLVFERAVALAGVSELVRRLGGADPTRQYLLVLCPASFETVTFAVAGPDGGVRHLTIDRSAPRPTDFEALAEMAAEDGEGGVALALRYARALDRSRITARFFGDFRDVRERIAHAWRGIRRDSAADRSALALLFLCRLLFLHFLQRLGHLAGEPHYLTSRWHDWLRGRPARATFYGRVLQPLFFGALNTRPANRSADARALGDLPYLNGGLFERTSLERRAPKLDLPDAAVGVVFDELFGRYRFTAVEARGAELGVDASGIDPEMLGRVFEGLMAPEQRGRTGTFFTPAHVVDSLVAGALDAFLRSRPGQARARLAALRSIRVLDPACGSGAFLLGALARLSAMRVALGESAAAARSGIVADSLHGVDVQADAALLCALRLWLALTLPAASRAGGVGPLPNLDRRIRQGDALLDPLDLGFPDLRSFPSGIRLALQREIAAIAPLARRYLASDPDERGALQRALRVRESRIARQWIDGWSDSAAIERRVLARRAAQRDLWGESTTDARAAADSLRRLDERAAEIGRLSAALRDSGSRPFFSFAVHFPEAALAGYDVILMNPPWVRPHRWPAALGGLVRRRYTVCRESGWASPELSGRSASAGQVDLAMLFLERAVGLLAHGGSIGALLPAKTLRSLYAGPARRLLLDDVRPLRIEDFSLDHRALFEADAFAMTLVAVKPEPTAPTSGHRPIRIVMRRPGRDPLEYDDEPENLPLVRGDPASPWLLAPPDARAALRRMQATGTPFGRIVSRRIRRGFETGANDALVVREAVARLGGLASIRAEGAFRKRAAGPAADYEGIIEDAWLAPLIRGADLEAWTFEVRRHLIRTRDSGGNPFPGCPRLRRYLERHGGRLGRNATRSPLPARGYRVAWHDLASSLRAVAVPPEVRTPFGTRPLVLLNTLYFAEVEKAADAFRFAACLNSLPIRVFAAAVAERAKDAHFRFFAWTASVLPIPSALADTADARRIETLSRRAHA